MERIAKPFIKWPGGKSQLLNELIRHYPFSDKKISRYAEPFVGGGAVLFDILNKFNLKEVFISDINKDLINTYIVIQNSVDELILLLKQLESKYLSYDIQSRKNFFLEKRELFNSILINDSKISISKAAIFIFLNKTCFNGLYRVNKSGNFNVPHGDHKNPTICNTKNLYYVSDKLKKVIIKCCDYKESENFITRDTFIYFDPPYRPLSTTSNFTSYTKDKFNDTNQIELFNYIKDINLLGAKILLSNSDPKNYNINDNFFDDIYKDFKIRRIPAKRIINCKKELRGEINEILISNF